MGNSVELVISAKDKTGKTLDGVSKGLGTVAKWAAIATGALAGTSAILFKISNDFNKSMANVASLIPESTARVTELKASVQDLSITMGQSTSDMAAGLYQVVSAFGDSENSMGKLEISAKAAKAGLSTTTEALSLLSAVTKGYGDTTAEATQKAADLAFQTVKLGQTTFPELASSIGRVVPLAAKLGIEQEELFAGFATLTGVTGGAAEVSTQLASIMRGALKPTEDMKVAVRELGFESASAVFDQLGLVDGMKALIGTTDGSEEAMGKLFQRVEGLTALFALTGGQADTFTEKLGAMHKRAGALDGAFKEQTQGLAIAAFKWEQLKTLMVVLAQTMGDKLAPMFEFIIDKATAMGLKVLDVLRTLPEAVAIVTEAMKELFFNFFTDSSYFTAFLESAAVMAVSLILGFGNMLDELIKITLKVSSVIWVPLGTGARVIFDEVRWSFETTLQAMAKLANKVLPQAFEFDTSKAIAPALTFKDAWEEGGLVIKDLFGSISDNLADIKAGFSETSLIIKSKFKDLADTPELRGMFAELDALLVKQGAIADEVVAKLGEVKDETGDTTEVAKTAWDSLAEHIKDTMLTVTDVMTGAWDTFKSGMGDAVAAAVVYGESLSEAFAAVLKNVAAAVISMLIQMGVERLAQFLLARALGVAEAASKMSILSMTTYASAFSSLAAIPIVGPFMAPAGAAAATAVMLAGAAAAAASGSAVGAAIGSAHGGLESVPEDATYAIKAGERVLTPGQNKDLESFMAGGGGGVTIKQLNIMPNASIDQALFNKPVAWWAALAKKKILPAMNVLGDLGATSSLKPVRGRI